MLNQSIHHEMIGPLKVNMDLCENMINHLQGNLECLEMAKIIKVTSNIILFHAHDMLDQRFLESGMFTPIYTQDSVTEAIKEVIEAMQFTLKYKRLTIQFNDNSLQDIYPVMEFDRRRLQQVVLNLLSNAAKF